MPLVLAAAGIAAAGCASAAGTSGGARTAPTGSAQHGGSANPNLDPGSSLGGVPAPDFSLTNQFGQRISLSAFRGKVVILAFTDSECTTVCPLTTQSMLAAKDLLGKAATQVQLLGIDANPAATKISDVMAYSRSHGMVNQWDFLTGTLPELKAVWKHYDIYVQITQGQVDHTPALYIIDARGREQKVYLTTMAYASITQAAQVMAQEAASLLPGHPTLASTQSLAYIGGLSPAKPATLPTLPSGSVTLGPGKPHLVVFFATWLDRDLRSAGPAARPEPVRAYRARRWPARAGRRRRGSRRAVACDRPDLPGRPRPAARLPGRARHDRQARRWLWRAGPAVVRAHLGHREDRLEARRLAIGEPADRSRPRGVALGVDRSQSLRRADHLLTSSAVPCQRRTIATNG